MSAIDDDNDLYTSLLPSYLSLDLQEKKLVCASFELLWRGDDGKRRGLFPKGEALKRAMIGYGVIIDTATVMDEDEYENIMAAQESMR